MRRNSIELPCLNCQKIIRRQKSRVRQRNFCSTECTLSFIKSINPAERFWKKVLKTDSCWIWTGTCGKRGYGHFTPHAGSPVCAHRFAYSIMIGPIPEGMLVCHTCDNPSCVRPEHLFLGTHKDNAEDMVRKNRQIRGDDHWTRLKPDNLKRGDAHPARLKPEYLIRGESVNTAKLTEFQVREIRKRHEAGENYVEISKDYPVLAETISSICRRRIWKHII